MNPGLDDVVVAETVLSHVDGVGGRLIVRGLELEEIAGRSFEAVVALLWDGLTSNPATEEAVRGALGAARPAAFEPVECLLPATDSLSPVEALRLLLSGLPDASTIPHHVLAVAAVPVFVAAIARRRQGRAPIAPDAGLGHAADFLRMMRGEDASAAHVRALETYLVTVADHGLNASTFTARVIASTRAGLLSSVVGALCAFKGPLHGGAPGPVLDMLDAIGSRANIHQWLTDALARDERLMGFGHRVYRVRDPRADVLKATAAALQGDENRIRFAGRGGGGAEAACASQAGEAARYQRRVLYRAGARGARDSTRQLHQRVRGRPCRRMERACAGAGAHRAPDPSAVALCRRRAAPCA